MRIVVRFTIKHPGGRGLIAQIDSTETSDPDPTGNVVRLKIVAAARKG